MRRVIRAGAAAVAVALAGVMLGAVSASAAKDPQSDYSYTITAGNTATITGYLGSNADLVIPTVIVDGGVSYPVTTIGNGALASRGLDSVILPEGITRIEREAFYRNNLTSIMLPEGLVSVGTSAFVGNQLSSLTLPSTLTGFPTPSQSVFAENLLTSINFGTGVTNLGMNTFAYNSELTSIVFPAQITLFGWGTFTRIPNLATVVFEGNAPTITAGNIQPDSVGSLGTVVNKIVYYYEGATGFTNPWGRYTTQMISAEAASLVVSPDAPVVADGTAAYTATATVLNALGAPIIGVTVDFVPQAGLSLSATSCVTDAAGVCAVTATSSTAGSFTLSAFLGTGEIGTPLAMVFDATASGGGDSAPVAGLAVTGVEVVPMALLAGGLTLLGVIIAFLRSARGARRAVKG